MEYQTKEKLNRENSDLTEKLPIKFLQFGEGNFLRAFVDYLIDKMNKEAGFNAGVAVVQPTQGGLVDMLEEQNNLYTLFVRGVKKGQIVDDQSVISAIQRSLSPYANYQEYLDLAKGEDLQFILSNTTEAGIAFDESETTLEAGPHKNFPAKVTAFLYERFKHFQGAEDKGLHIIPCELIENNGLTLKKYILQYAQLWNLEEGFSAWVENSNSFHNTLVDRIVPGYPREEKDEYEAKFGYDDNLMVVCEAFLLWVIEGDDKLRALIPFDKIDDQVLIVDDITPYRTRKVRILNGAHTAMLAFSILDGKETVKEAIDAEFAGKFISDTVYNEIIPTLDLSKEELTAFAEEVFDRFRNPFLKHQLSSIALNSVAKFKVRVLPSLLQYVDDKKELPVNLTFALAALIRFYQGEFNGKTLPVMDDAPVLERLKEIWTNNDLGEVVKATLSETSFWDTDLTQVPGLTEAVTKALKEIDANGIEQGYNNYIK
ncbi:tagaturonate reductase [Epilithonimonas sp. JDS]|uniref:tagaturonate reductase n=1 Tax=Epilithonimonas sp. JDS TaxID=2902797 RepID=UPI001E2E7E89|nr:tagaturonate reductase [Epilithonimonas sp. JDS]MCD9855435.1 tagaturonate reductase [Epilithonimonas sp. JDS]